MSSLFGDIMGVFLYKIPLPWIVVKMKSVGMNTRHQKKLFKEDILKIINCLTVFIV